jgi:hypothetical protein
MRTRTARSCAIHARRQSTSAFKISPRINTSRLFAEKLLTQYTAYSTRWREYMFQRYVDIIVKQQVYELQKRKLNLAAEKIDDITSRVHDAASGDLEQFLFEETLSSDPAEGAQQ